MNKVAQFLRIFVPTKQETMANIEIKIDDKLYGRLCEFCKVNNIGEVTEYVRKKFVDGFMVDMYGDLNQKMRKSEPKTDNKADVNELTTETTSEFVSEEPLKTDNISDNAGEILTEKSKNQQLNEVSESKKQEDKHSQEQATKKPKRNITIK